ncbi:MAG: hypothetical protein U5L45_25660 [Saprospiraceae bacterium]|nr:hypothetical protein [Saprospiraceae bacterium]
MRSLRSREEGEYGSFFGQSPKSEPPLLLLRERSERVNQPSGVVYGFKIFITILKSKLTMRKLIDVKNALTANELLSIAATVYIKGGAGDAAGDEKRRRRPDGGISTNRPSAPKTTK